MHVDWLGLVMATCPQLGAFVAAIRDLEFDVYAYANVMVYNVLTALYLVLISRTKANTGLSTFGMMQYNNIVCIPALAALCIIDGSFAYDCHGHPGKASR